MVNQTQDSGCKDVTTKIGFARTPDGLSTLKKMLDDKGIYNEIVEDKDVLSNEKHYDLKVSWCKSDITDKIKDLIEGCTVPNDTPDARDIIAGAGGDHVLQVWEDGELTSTKGGELYGKRTLHRIGYPGKIKIIETSGEDDHQNRIVKPECGKRIKDLTNLLFYVGTTNNRVEPLMKSK